MSHRTSVPPGWYPDPFGHVGQRYWDGSAWTENTAAVLPPRPAASRTSPTGSLPWWQSAWGIVLGLLLCFPVGLVGLWRRPGLATSVRAWVTGAVLVLAVVVVAMPTDEPQSSPVPRGLADLSTPTASPATGVQPGAGAPRVPSVVGLNRQAANNALIAAGLAIGAIDKQASSSAPGTVLKQSLEPGTASEPGKTVALVVASPFPRLLGVVGMSRSAAVEALEAKGFHVTTSKRAVASGENGVVLSQSPKEGSRLQPGSTIRLVLANVKDPEPPSPSNCTAGYSPCLPPASDYDCGGGSGNGPEYVYQVVTVTGSDPYELDNDGDGFGCD